MFIVADLVSLRLKIIFRYIKQQNLEDVTCDLILYRYTMNNSILILSICMRYNPLEHKGLKNQTSMC